MFFQPIICYVEICTNKSIIPQISITALSRIFVAQQFFLTGFDSWHYASLGSNKNRYMINHLAPSVNASVAVTLIRCMIAKFWPGWSACKLAFLIALAWSPGLKATPPSFERMAVYELYFFPIKLQIFESSNKNTISTTTSNYGGPLGLWRINFS